MPGEQILQASEGIVLEIRTASDGSMARSAMLVGSVAEELLEGATHPVLVLPRQAVPALPESTRTPTAVEA